MKAKELAYETRNALRIERLLAALKRCPFPVKKRRGLFVLSTEFKDEDWDDFVLSREVSKLVVQGKGGCSDPAYTLEDFCLRLCKLGFCDFRKRVNDEWGSTLKSKSRYLEMCAKYRINPEGRTESMPSVHQVRNLARRFGLKRHDLGAMYDGKMVTEDSELKKIFEQIRVHERLGVALGLLVQQGSSASATASLDRAKLYERNVTLHRADVSIFSGPSLLVETMLQTFDSFLIKAGFKHGLFSLKASEWVVLLTFLKDPSGQTFLALSLTNFFTWLSQVVNVSVVELISFFNPELGEEFNDDRPNMPMFFGEREQSALDHLVQAEEYLKTGKLSSEVLQHQGDAIAEGDGFLDLLTRAKNSPMWKKVSTLVFYIIGAKFLEGTALGDAVTGGLARMANSIGSVTDGLVTLNDCLTYIYKRFLVVIEKGDIKEFFEKDAATIAIVEMKKHIAILGRKDLMDPRGAVADAEICASRYMKLNHPIVTTVLRELIDLTSHYRASLQQARKAPAAYLICGRPGLGKNTLVSEIEDRLKRALGLAPDIGIVYQIQGTNHQTVPPVAHIMLKNDCLTEKDEHTTVNQLDLFQEICDTALLKVETASLAEKANSILNPKLFLATTNATKYVFTKSTKDGPSKLNRRVHLLHLGLSAAYLKRFNGNETAAIAALSEHYDASAVEYRFGRLNIPLNSNEMDLRLGGDQSKWEKKVYTDSESVSHRIILHTLEKMRAERPVTKMECAGCSFRKDLCICATLKKDGLRVDAVPPVVKPQTWSFLEISR